MSNIKNHALSVYLGSHKRIDQWNPYIHFIGWGMPLLGLSMYWGHNDRWITIGLGVFKLSLGIRR